jgi:hypothetical protein
VIGPALCRMIFCFMAGLLLHLECVSIGSLSHPAGDRPSHPISIYLDQYHQAGMEI